MGTENDTSWTDESPFGHPPLMGGYPLNKREQQAVDEVLTEYRRARARECPAEAEAPVKAKRRFC